MSDTLPVKISDEEFKQCLDALGRSAENSRSVFFAYVVIFGALLVWALNAIIFPAEQQRIGQIRQKQIETIRCLAKIENFKAGFADSKNVNKNDGVSKEVKDCSKSFEDTSLDALLAQDSNVFQGKGSGRIDLLKIDTDYMQHEINYQLDKSYELSRFSIPVIGVASDRTWLWLISMILGPLLYYLIKDSLANLNYLLGYLYEKSINQPTRLALLSVAQVVTASTQQTLKKSDDITQERRDSTGKLTMLSLVLALPLVLSSLIIYDWYYFITNGVHIACPTDGKFITYTINCLCIFGIIHNYTRFLEEPEFWGGILTFPVLAFEVVLFRQIFGLLKGLSHMHHETRHVARRRGIPVV